MFLKKFLRFSPLVCACIVSAGMAFAQTPAEPFGAETFAIHPKGGFLLGNNTSDFSVFQGLTNYCKPYTSHFTSNFSGGIFGELPILSRTHLGMGIGFSRRNSRFTSEQSYPERDTTAGQNIIRDVLYENEVLANLAFVEIQPEIRYILLDQLFNGPLRSVAALRFSLPVQADYTQTDRVVSPDNATFAPDAQGNKVREKTISGGDFSTKNALGFGVSAGLENLLKVGETTHFTQQVLFDYNFTNVLSDAAWKPWAIRAELGLRFGVLQLPPKEKPIEIIPPVKEPVVIVEETPAPPALQLTITDLKATLQTGNELLASAPLVNAVFFEKSSAEIPGRYDRASTRNNTSEAAANNSFKSILPRIAEIVFKNPKAKIILEGATAGATDEPEGIELARKRAEAVKAVLKSLGVPESSISTKSAVQPRNPSNQEFPAGREENRRVDIIVQNAPLQEYVARQQFAQVKGGLTTEVTLYNIPESSPLELKTSCSENSTEVKSVSGTKGIQFTCKLAPDQQDFSIDATAFSSYAGKAATDSRRVVLNTLPKEQIELKTDNFNAVLRFDYNSSTLSAENKELLKQMSELLPSGSTLSISGSSDVTSGSEQRNAELSAARAKATEDFLKEISGNKFTLETSTDTQKFSEETPEGRFLNRSIRVQVKK